MFSLRFSLNLISTPAFAFQQSGLDNDEIEAVVAAVVSLGPSVCSYEWGVGWLQHAIENTSQPIPRCAAEVLIRLGHHALTIPGVPVWVECAVASSHSHHAPVAFSLIRALGADALQHLPWLSDWLRITITTGTVKYVSTCMRTALLIFSIALKPIRLHTSPRACV